MSYTDEQLSSTIAAIDKYRGDDTGEIGAALAVVGLSAERASKEMQVRDDKGLALRSAVLDVVREADLRCGSTTVGRER